MSAWKTTRLPEHETDALWENEAVWSLEILSKSFQSLLKKNIVTHLLNYSLSLLWSPVNNPMCHVMPPLVTTLRGRGGRERGGAVNDPENIEDIHSSEWTTSTWTESCEESFEESCEECLLVSPHSPRLSHVGEAGAGEECQMPIRY